MPPIVAILNCYSPATGANLSQVIVRGSGDVQISGDESLARIAIGQLLNARLAAAPEKRGPGRPRKALPPSAP